MLTLIEVLDHFEFKRDVYLAFLDMGELAGFGARSLFNDPRLLEGSFLELFMIAHDTDQDRQIGNFNLYANNDDSKELAKKISALSRRSQSGVRFEYQADQAPPMGVLSFYPELNIDALLLTQNLDTDQNPRILSSNDFVETLNVSSFHGAFHSIAMIVLSQLMMLE